MVIFQSIILLVFLVLLGRKYYDFRKTKVLCDKIISTKCASTTFGVRVRHYYKRLYTVEYTINDTTWKCIKKYYSVSNEIDDYYGFVNDAEIFAATFHSIQDVTLYHLQQRELKRIEENKIRPYTEKRIV